MSFPYVVILSGPEKTRAKAELALEKAHLTIIPPKEWPICRESYQAKHWPHLTQLPSGQPPDDDHGFLGVLAETEAAFHASYGVVAKAKWVLRVHRELGEKPKPVLDFAATLQQLQDRIDALEAGRV
jgi:hypothetical protein